MSLSWNDEQTEKLIALVFQRSALWEGTHPQGKNSYFIGKLWQDVALRMGLPESKEGKDKVRYKWRSLVSKYTLEKSKVENVRSGAGADEAVQSSWPYYSALQFLNNSVSKKSQGNIDFLNNQAASKSDIPAESKKQEPDDIPGDVTKDQSFSVGNNSKSSIPIECLTFEEADWNNFISLMPYLNDINEIKNKLQFRMEVMYFLLKYIDEENKSIEVHAVNEKDVKKEKEEVKIPMKEFKKEKQENERKTMRKDDEKAIEEIYISDDEVLEVDLSSLSKKIKLERIPDKPAIKQEIEASEEFNDYVKNHFFNIKKE